MQEINNNYRILAVDDDSAHLLLLREYLTPFGFQVRSCTSGSAALEAVNEFRPHIVLLDVGLPDMEGFDVCRRILRARSAKSTKVLMISARSDLSSRLKGYEAGAVDFVIKPFFEEEVLEKVRRWRNTVSYAELDELLNELDVTRDAIGLALATMAGFRDTETGEHLFRLRWYAQALAEHLALEGPYAELIDETFLRNLYRASPLHDIGKVAIGDAVLLKPGKLSPGEFELMKRHTTLGAELLERAAEQLRTSGFLAMAIDIARHHHERFDGSGYPDGLAGHTIPLSARIVAVADVLDALLTKRVYKEAFPFQDAVSLIYRDSGSHFDPSIVSVLRQFEDEFQYMHDRFSSGDFSASLSLFDAARTTSPILDAAAV